MSHVLLELYLYYKKIIMEQLCGIPVKMSARTSTCHIGMPGFRCQALLPGLLPAQTAPGRRQEMAQIIWFLAWTLI